MTSQARMRRRADRVLRRLGGKPVAAAGATRSPAGVDSVFEARADALHTLHGRDTTVRRPHSVRRVDRGVVSGNFAVKNTAASGSSSVVCHVLDVTEKDARGRIFAGTTITVNTEDYVVQSNADGSSNAWTLNLSPDLSAQAMAGDAVTLPDYAEYSGFTRIEQSLASRGYNPSGFTAGTKIFDLKPPTTLPLGYELLQSGNDGDYLADSTGSNLGRVTQILDDDPESLEVMVG